MQGVIEAIARLMAWAAQWSLALEALILFGALFRRVAYSARSTLMQYVWLGAFVVVESVVLVPLLSRAAAQAPGAIRSAAFLTLIAFSCGTVAAFALRRDLSSLGALVQSGLGLGLIAVATAIVFGFSLGTGFALVMLASGLLALLHDVSAVIQEGGDDEDDGASLPDRHAAASLSLFATMVLMFWSSLALFAAV
jgi:FtsH-binding integral membrane protein